MDRESIRQWTERIDREIEACRPQLIEDTVRMIAVKSVKGNVNFTVNKRLSAFVFKQKLPSI